MLIQQIRRDDVQAIEQVADALVGVVGRATHHADDLVPLREKELGEVGAVLPRDPGDERRAAGLLLPLPRLSFSALSVPGPLGGARSFRAHSLSDRFPWRE